MISFPSRVLPVVVFVVSCLAGAARAQEAPTASAAEPEASASASDARVEVSALREPIEFPYERAYAVVAKVREASGGSADLVFRIVDKKPVAAPMRVSVQYGETIEQLALDRSNSFTLPSDPVALANHAVLVANRPRHGLMVDVGIRPHVEAGAVLTLADVNRLVEGGKAARKALLPWYARIVVPGFRGLRLCSLSNGAQFALRDAAGAEHPLSVKDDDDLYDRRAHCAEVESTDKAAEMATALVMPADSTVDYAVTAF